MGTCDLQTTLTKSECIFFSADCKGTTLSVCLLNVALQFEKLLKMPNAIKIKKLSDSVTHLWISIVLNDTHGTRKINLTYCMKFHIGELHHKFY